MDTNNTNKIIEFLNEALNAEFHSFKQYFFHSSFLKKLGCSKIATIWHKESQEELEHAEKIINRIYEMKGNPIIPQQYNLNIGKDIVQIIQNDLNLELKGKEMYQNAISFCETAKDFYTRNLFEDIIIGEESHIIFLQNQLDIIESIGLENYILNQM